MRTNPEKFQKLVNEYREKAKMFNDTISVYDAETMDAVDAFRKEHALDHAGNPRGLVDWRFVEALNAAYQVNARRSD